ncbi:ATP-binding protein [Streptomyces sp. DSM 41636]|uniref:ATP-binding protein n=1 Tax=Streptomyces edwardsiae TaxID=3075527 RepID=A0ABU2Q258_9ACTN|nr:ATP-binding protein [Streptomyces sp. DSM 41636]MDT0398502.1 ATP-binding protein [Streptomyces sp. DSM 41636]
MQVSEARRFQQLRGHLSYLKLNDAAEALNRVLDQARTERMSLTAALERLLEIEVEATEARKLATRERFACLPEPWTLADFDFAAQPGVDEKLIRDLATLRFLDDASNVLFVGPPGWVRPCCRSPSDEQPSTPATVSTSPPPPNSPPSATRPPSKAAGRPACASSQVRSF